MADTEFGIVVLQVQMRRCWHEGCLGRAENGRRLARSVEPLWITKQNSLGRGDLEVIKSVMRGCTEPVLDKDGKPKKDENGKRDRDWRRAGLLLRREGCRGLASSFTASGSRSGEAVAGEAVRPVDCDFCRLARRIHLPALRAEPHVCAPATMAAACRMVKHIRVSELPKETA